MRSSKLLRLGIVLLLVGLTARLASQGEASWAATGQDIERQTVPTRTDTPGPVTPTIPPTATPTKPPSATHTPALTPSATGTLASPTASVTPMLTLTPSDLSASANTILPVAGGGPWLSIGGALLLLNGALLLLAGLQARWWRR